MSCNLAVSHTAVRRSVSANILDVVVPINPKVRHHLIRAVKKEDVLDRFLAHVYRRKDEVDALSKVR